MNKRLWSIAALALAGTSCNNGPSLSGSISEFFPLAFTAQQITVSQDAFQVTYLDDTGVDEDVVARVTVDTTGLDFTSGKSFDLSGEYAPGHPRAVVTHSVGSEPPRNLPTVAVGTLTIGSGGQAGQPTQGSFELSFSKTGGDFGNGDSLNGNFDAMALGAQ